MDADEKAEEEEEEEEDEEDSSFAKQKGCEHPFTAFRFFNGTPSARPPRQSKFSRGKGGVRGGEGGPFPKGPPSPPRLLYSSPSKARLAPMTGP